MLPLAGYPAWPPRCARDWVGEFRPVLGRSEQALREGVVVADARSRVVGQRPSSSNKNKNKNKNKNIVVNVPTTHCCANLHHFPAMHITHECR
jgi:hypothetical protein